LYVFLVLAHERRCIVHFAVTAHPTAEWTTHQLREAFPWESAPRYFLRDRDRIFSQDFVEQVNAMGIKQVLQYIDGTSRYINRTSRYSDRSCFARLKSFV
jgi:putative transposase